jgi:NADPH-dependent ferric siderophore reductase
VRSRRTGRPLEHVLVAGDRSELDTIRTVLALLPDHAYGQVLLETDTEVSFDDVARPARVTVTCVRRQVGAPAGQRLSETLRAWAAEWMPDQADPDREVTAWVGSTVSGVPGLEARFERL